MNLSNTKINTAIFWVAGILLLAFSSYRAWNIPMTVDEGTTWFVYAQFPLIDVFLNRPVNTNNHFLNTFLIKFTTSLFGGGIVAIRLSSLFGHLLYIIFSFKLIKLISNRTIVVLTAIVLLHFNPYLNDFFGLARGYSLSWGMMMASMYYLYQYILLEKNKHIAWSFVFAVLSVYSILIQLNYFLGLIAAFNFVFLLQYLRSKNLSAEMAEENRQNWFFFFFKKNKIPLIASTVLFALLAYPISFLRNQNEFYGNRAGFMQDTIMTLVNQSLFSKKYFGSDFPEVLVGIAITVYVVVLFLSIKKLIKNNFTKRDIGASAFCILFTIPCWSTIAQFHLLGTPYLADRTGLILVPLFSMIPIFFFTYFKEKKWLQILACAIPLTAYSYHFYNSANTFTTREWWFDTNNKDVINYMLENEDLSEQRTLGLYGWNSPSFTYHVKDWKLEDKIKIVRRNQLKKEEFYDYYYIEGTWLDKISREEYEVIENFDSRVLLKRKSTFVAPATK